MLRYEKGELKEGENNQGRVITKKGIAGSVGDDRI